MVFWNKVQVSALLIIGRFLGFFLDTVVATIFLCFTDILLPIFVADFFQSTIFKNSGDVAESKNAKKSITHSNNCCINFQSTDNIAIVDNVAHETYEHCCAIQDGTDTGNIFISNFSAVTRKATLPIMGESDITDAATF